MNWADWAIFAILFLSMLIGIVRGLVKEAMSLAVWISAGALAMLLYPSLAVYLVDLIRTPSLRFLTAWAGIFVAVLLVGGLLNYLLGKLVDATGLSGTDRLLGLVFGAARGGIIIMAILVILPGILPVAEDAWWHQSILIPQFLRFEGWAREVAATVYSLIQQLF
ncbi:colicin V production CvpA [Gammaproteobacteria bacterium 53_120_T64]|nr:colicin V production CvpA [Gammaproteobacteria bacterium 53_120_T64]